MGIIVDYRTLTDRRCSPLLFDDIYTKLLNHGDGSETVAQETINQQIFDSLIVMAQETINQQIFDSLITFSQEEHQTGKPRSNVLAHYITDPGAKYEACPRKVCGYTFSQEEHQTGKPRSNVLAHYITDPGANGGLLV
eukprot:sb/3474431/